MDERLKFIARLLDGEKMAVLCRQFGISRKTGYKILTRYNEIGLEGLTDRSRRPYRHANQLPFQIETQIVRLKQDRPDRSPRWLRQSPLCQRMIEDIRFANSRGRRSYPTSTRSQSSAVISTSPRNGSGWRRSAPASCISPPVSTPDRTSTRLPARIGSSGH